jgi:hypothetical protein
MKFLQEVFNDGFMSLDIATSQQQLIHVGTSTVMDNYNVFPIVESETEDPISV